MSEGVEVAGLNGFRFRVGRDDDVLLVGVVDDDRAPTTRAFAHTTVEMSPEAALVLSKVLAEIARDVAARSNAV